jgi:hypothetical protein
MRELPRPVGIAFLVFLVADFALILYMATVGGLAHTPLQALPPIYWVLLLAYPALGLIMVFYPQPSPFEMNIKGIFGDAKSSAVAQTLIAVINSGGLLFLGYVSTRALPEWGGLSAFLIAGGATALVRAYAYYRRYQLLK